MSDVHEVASPSGGSDGLVPHSPSTISPLAPNDDGIYSVSVRPREFVKVDESVWRNTSPLPTAKAQSWGLARCYRGNHNLSGSTDGA